MLSQEKIRSLPAYDGHIEVVSLHDQECGLEAYIALYNQRGTYPSLGATRWWAYASSEEAVTDALRLAKTMACKAVMADVPYGGGKAVIRATTTDPLKREAQLRAYARGVQSLKGRFVTGTDVGVSDQDLDILLSETEYIIGKGVPSAWYTAQGVFLTLCRLVETALSRSVYDISVAIQGLGKTGEDLARLCVGAGMKVYGCDIDEKKAVAVAGRVPGLRVCGPEELLRMPIDVFSPCGVGGAVHETMLQNSRAQIIVGAANNQVLDQKTDQLLLERGIWYAPDFMVNAGGLLSVIDHYEHGTSDEERIMERVRLIPERIMHVLNGARSLSKPIQQYAEALALAKSTM